MKLLVTGGSGFIGSHFIHHMLEKHPSYEIVNFDALTYAGCEMNNDDLRGNSRYRFVHGDICNPSDVDAVMPDVDAVVHFAAESHVDNSIENSMVFTMTNVMGTLNLLEAARRHGNKRFHHISTDEVFGHLHPDQEPFHEGTPFSPRSPYSASKAASDHLAMSYYHTHGLPLTISNCSNNYGSHMFPEKMMPLFITNILQGKKVPLYGDGLNVRDWIHVRDHNRAVDEILHHGEAGHTYCVGANNEKTNRQITELLLNLLGVGDEYIEYVQDRKGHDRRYAINNTKICTALNWRPEISFEDGLAEMVNWYRTNESWWKSIKDGSYKMRNEHYKSKA